MSLWFTVHGIEASYPPPTWEAAAYLGSQMPLPGDNKDRGYKAIMVGSDIRVEFSTYIHL